MVLPAKNFLPYVAILPWGTRRNYPQQVENTCANPLTGPANGGAKLGQFGRHIAANIRRRSAGQFADKWHLDEVVITMSGKKHWLWSAIDQDGFVLNVLGQSHRNKASAMRLMRKLLK